MANTVAMVGEYNFTNKERVTIRIDKDILAWCKSLTPKGRGYQTRINQCLRDHMNNTIPTVTDLESLLRRVLREELAALKK